MLIQITPLDKTEAKFTKVPMGEKAGEMDFRNVF